MEEEKKYNHEVTVLTFNYSGSNITRCIRFNSLKHGVQVTFKISVPTSNRTKCLYIITISWIILFEKMIAVHSKNRKQPINVPCGQNEELLNVKASVTYSYHFALTG
jgi:hypothetical protein